MNKRGIRNISYLLIFRNQAGEVLHFVPLTEKDVLPTGLAKRCNLWDYENKITGFMLRGQKIPIGLDFQVTAIVDVELEVLTYDFVESNQDQNLLDAIQK